MDRRDTIKTILLGTVSGGIVTAGVASCETPAAEPAQPETNALPGYGRTPKEKEWDEKVLSETFLTAHEMSTIAILCDIILPADEKSGSATDAGVPDFIEFIVKDMPNHQLPMRGGLMWLDHEANKRYNLDFKSCSNEQRLAIVDDIAYPDVLEENENSIFAPGIRFFSLMRDLTLTGFYTSKMGVMDDLGYQGNVANVWDGVPEDVLKEHGLAYDEKLLPLYLDVSKREVPAEWDDAGNLLT